MQKKILDGTPFQDWVNEQVCGNEMLWKGAFGVQSEFIRDELTPLIESGMNFYERKDDQIARVISTHMSKSITLPVVRITRQDLGISFIVRNNFFNWQLTVLSEKPTEADFGPLFRTVPPPEPDYTGDELSSVYFEGFPENLVRGYYSQDKRQWSASIGSDFALWTVVFLCMQSIGALEDKKYHTRESHEKAMEAEKAARISQKGSRLLSARIRVNQVLLYGPTEAFVMWIGSNGKREKRFRKEGWGLDLAKVLYENKKLYDLACNGELDLAGVLHLDKWGCDLEFELSPEDGRDTMEVMALMVHQL